MRTVDFSSFLDQPEHDCGAAECYEKSYEKRLAEGRTEVLSYEECG